VFVAQFFTIGPVFAILRCIAILKPETCKMPTVALVGSELYPIPPIRGGGAELFMEQTARHLHRWRPVIIGVADPDLPLSEVSGPVQYRRVPLRGWRRWLYCRYRQYYPYYDRAVAGAIKELKPDLIHVHNRPLLVLSLRRRLGDQIPIILHMHNLYDSLGKRERPEPGAPLPVAGFIACSRFVLEREKDRLARGAALHRVVYNGVDPQAFPSLWEHAPEVRAHRASYQLASEPTVLFAGKLREAKGVHILLAAMNRVWESIPRAVLVLAGGTEYGHNRTMRATPFLKRLRQLVAAAPGRVVLTGFLPPEQMPGAYLLGDVFVGPSQVEEGLGLVFLEAAAAGLPVIATRRGGIPEVVRDGETGLLLQEMDNPQELAAKILLLLTDAPLQERLGRQGRAWVQQNFSWGKIAWDLEEVYNEVIAGCLTAA
jgi:spore coat protein SA